MDTMRYKGWSGNSEGVRLQLEEKLLKQKGFENIEQILAQPPQIISALEKNDTSFLEKMLGKDIA